MDVARAGVKSWKYKEFPSRPSVKNLYRQFSAKTPTFWIQQPHHAPISREAAVNLANNQ
jgi:hypothetical protein